MKKTVNLLSILFVLVAVCAFAQAPKTLHYQGIVSDGGGPLNGSYNLTFTIYDAASGGTSLWTESSTGVAATAGNVSLTLGKTTPVNIQIDKPLWMGITVGANPEISPRMELAASLYSLGVALPFSGVSNSGSYSFEIANTSIGGRAAHFQNSNASNNNPVILINHAGEGNAITADAPIAATGFIGDGSQLTNLPSTGWGLTGNSGTADGTNFIGTTDGAPLNFVVSNQKAGRIDPNGPVFLGVMAGDNNAAAFSTGIGYQALQFNTNGFSNTAIGSQALASNTTGYSNTATGVASLFYNVSGIGNTGIGDEALYNATGHGNTALGLIAGFNITTGSDNIAIGDNAQVPIPTASGQIRIGSSAITYAGVQVPWTVTSDKRWKSDIKQSDLGLNFINKLKPVSYFRTNDESKRREYGFIAQELEETLISSGAADNGIISKDDKGMYSVRYNDLMAPMAKAIQEQQQIIESLHAEIALLRNQHDAIVGKLEADNRQIKSDLEARLKKIEDTLGLKENSTTDVGSKE